jgi:hypothetical protein
MKANKKYKSYRKEVGGPGKYKKKKEPYMDYPKHKFPEPKVKKKKGK